MAIKRKHDDDTNSTQHDGQSQKRQKKANHKPRSKDDGKEDKTSRAINQLPKTYIKLDAIAPYQYPTPTLTRGAPPPLPEITDHRLASTPFKHCSTVKQNTGLITGLYDSYERLEFLGDAYLEVFATRLLFHRFAFHTPARDFSPLSQIRSDIVNNETLSGLANHYDFLDKLDISQKAQILAEPGKDGRRITKILGDSFEAFVAAVTLDKNLGIVAAEQWMAELWEDRIRSFSQKHGLREHRQPARVPRVGNKSTSSDDAFDLDPSQLTSSKFHRRALEFLGSAYVEFFATCIVFSRFDNMSPGRMSQITEKLIKNETLARLASNSKVPALESFENKTHKNPKEYTRALAEAYRAYIGGEVLKHESDIGLLQKRLLGLWAPFLLEEIESDRVLKYGPAANTSDLRKIYDPEARMLLQKRIMGSLNPKLQYEKSKASVELKGDKLGQSQHYMALYLTGYGYERKFLAEGEGRSKAEASNWAAIEAMYGDNKQLIDQCEIQNLEERKRRNAEKLAKEQALKAQSETEGEQLQKEAAATEHAESM